MVETAVVEMLAVLVKEEDSQRAQINKWAGWPRAIVAINVENALAFRTMAFV